MDSAKLETLAAELHEVYEIELKRQGRTSRHATFYCDLPEEIKDLDRALARFIESRDQELAARHAEEVKALARRWRTLAGSPDDWITTGDETDTAIRTAGRSTMTQCAEELEKL